MVLLIDWDQLGSSHWGVSKGWNHLDTMMTLSLHAGTQAGIAATTWRWLDIIIIIIIINILSVSLSVSLSPSLHMVSTWSVWPSSQHDGLRVNRLFTWWLPSV